MRKNKIILAALIGNLIEYFDFTLFGFFSPLFADLFFPDIEPRLALLSTLGIFAASFIIRPIGGVIFGHLGDKFGRRTSLSASILLMAIATLSIALIPTYEQVGIYASIGLCIFRMLQGLSTGGEFNGAFIFLIEHSQKEKAGFIGSLVVSSSAVGAFFAVMCGAIATQPQMPSWSWRIPFLVGSIFGIIGLYLRLKVEESPEFLQKGSDTNKNFPFVQAIKENWTSIIRTMGVGGFCLVLVNMLIVYLNVYLNKNLGLRLSEVFWLNNLALLVSIFAAPVAGKISDKVGQALVMKSTAVASFLLAYPLFFLINTKNFGLILFSEIIFGILAASYAGTANAFMYKMFPIHTRYSGIAFSYCMGSAILGGMTPILSTYLIQVTGNLMMPAFYICACAIIGFVCVYESKGKSLIAVSPVKGNI